MITRSRANGRRASLIASLLSALLLSACDSGSSGVGEGNTLAFLTVTDGRGVQPEGVLEVFQCLPSQLFVIGTFDDGSRDGTIGFRDGLVWASSNENLVRVSNGDIVIDGITHPKGSLIASDLASAENQTATISVSFLGLTASQDVIVRPGTLEVSPTRQTIAVGTALQMFATAIFGRDGATDSTGTNLAADFSGFVDWSSDNTAVATVDANGVVSAVTAGSANIQARTGVNCPVPADLVTQVIVQNTSLSIADPFDFRLTNQFDFADIGLSTSSFVRLIGKFANGLRQDLTGQADLTSDDPTVVSEFFTNLITAKGAAGGADSTTLTASFDPDGDGGQSAVTEQQPVTVDDEKRLTALNIDPAGTATMLQGATLDLDALGSFDDATVQSLYRNVFWTSSDDTLATANIAGIVAAGTDSTGPVTITATRTDPLSLTTFDDTLSITVVDTSAVTGLQVDCDEPILVGTAADCRATVNFTGGQTQDVSLSSVWSSSAPAVAEVSNVRLAGARRNEVGDTTPLPGRVYAVSEGGPVEIRASLFDGDGVRIATATDTVTTTTTPPDTDSDGVPDATDNCPNTANANQANNDNDAQGDVCDPDDDNDGDLDGADNCPLAANANQANNDNDAQGDVCDPDDDNDGVEDGSDQCPLQSSGAIPSNSRPGCPCSAPFLTICLE